MDKLDFDQLMIIGIIVKYSNTGITVSEILGKIYNVLPDASYSGQIHKRYYHFQLNTKP